MSVTHWMAAAIVSIFPLTGSANDKTPRADPANVAAPVSPSAYQSAFAGYQPLQDVGEPTPENWRAVNDEVGRVGGHAGQIKEATPLPQSAPRDQVKKQETVPADQPMRHKH